MVALLERLRAIAAGYKGEKERIPEFQYFVLISVPVQEKDWKLCEFRRVGQYGNYVAEDGQTILQRHLAQVCVSQL